LKCDFVNIALRKQFQGEVDLQLWTVARKRSEGHRCLVARSKAESELA
jgi:hypothetical protein